MSPVKTLWLYQEAGILVGISLTHLYDNCLALPGWSLGQGHHTLCQKQGEEALLSPALGPLIEGPPKGSNLRGQTEVNWFRILSTFQKNQKTLSQIQRVREGNKNTWQKQLKERRGVYCGPQLEGTAIMGWKVLTGALKQLVTLYPYSGRGGAGAQLFTLYPHSGKGGADAQVAFPLLFSLRPQPTNGVAHI